MTTCAECHVALPADAKACAACGHQVGPWGSCPECKGAIAAEQAVCKECGFPLKAVPKVSGPVPVSAPPPAKPSRSTTRMIGRKGRRRRGGKGRPLLEPGEEPPSAMIFAVLGLFVPILAIIGLVQSKRGSGANILSWIDLALWITSVLFFVSRAHS